jgi:hypothetical protein
MKQAAFHVKGLLKNNMLSPAIRRFVGDSNFNDLAAKSRRQPPGADRRAQQNDVLNINFDI